MELRKRLPMMRNVGTKCEQSRASFPSSSLLPELVNHVVRLKNQIHKAKKHELRRPPNTSAVDVQRPVETMR